MGFIWSGIIIIIIVDSEIKFIIFCGILGMVEIGLDGWGIVFFNYFF